MTATDPIFNPNIQFLNDNNLSNIKPSMIYTLYLLLSNFNF